MKSSNVLMSAVIFMVVGGATHTVNKLSLMFIQVMGGSWLAKGPGGGVTSLLGGTHGTWPGTEDRGGQVEYARGPRSGSFLL